MLNSFQSDQDLLQFIRGAIDFNKLEYRKKSEQAFVRGCVDKQLLLHYENERLLQLHETIMKIRSKSSFDELDGEF